MPPCSSAPPLFHGPRARTFAPPQGLVFPSLVAHTITVSPHTLYTHPHPRASRILHSRIASHRPRSLRLTCSPLIRCARADPPYPPPRHCFTSRTHARTRTDLWPRNGLFCFLCVFSSISSSSPPSPSPWTVDRPPSPSTLIISVWTSCLPRPYLLPLDIVCIPLCSAPPPSPVSRRSLLVYVARGTSASLSLSLLPVDTSPSLRCALVRCRWGVRSLT